jgi:hypothetical protein
MIISHDRQTLFIGVPKNGSQTARAVLGQIGVDLVGEMGRHPTVPEAIRLAEVRFPGETIAPAAIYAFWGSVAKIVKLEHAWRRLDGRNDDGFQVAPFPG